MMYRFILVLFFFAPYSLCYAQCELPSGWAPVDTFSGATTGPLTLPSEAVIESTLELFFDADFISTYIEVLPGVSIIVKSGVTLTIISAYLTSGGQGMWEGIVLEPGSTLLFEGSGICYANIAVDSKGSGVSVGDFDIQKSEFYKNQIGIRVKNYDGTGPHPGSISENLITGGSLAPDASTPFGVIGIQVKNVNNGIEGFTVGGGSGVNTITDLDIGVDISNSIVAVQGNRFERCQDINGYNLGYGVRSTASETDSDLFVTTSIFSLDNQFDGCRFGVATNGLRNIEIAGTTMTNTLGLHLNGIRVQNSIPGATILITDNIIEQFKNEGVRLDDNSGTVTLPIVAEIEENTISTFTTSAQVRTGIYVEEPTTGSNLDLTIDNENNISGVQIGIYTSNVTDASIEDNAVTFDLPAGAPDDAIGIFCVQCEGAIVRKNEITGNCLPPCTYNPTNIRIRGIAMNNCPSAELQTNIVEGCGLGALIYNDSQNGNAVCNSFDNCGVGFAFEDIGDMGTPYGPVEGISSGIASDNSWTVGAPQTVTIGMTDGFLVPWYYRSSGPAEYIMLSSLNTTAGGALNEINIQPVAPTLPICDGYLRTDSSDQFVLAEPIEHLLDSAITINSGSALPNWVYSQLERYYHDGISDAKVLAAIALTNIEQLSEVDELINTHEFASALNSLSTVFPINLWEVNKKEVLQLLAIASDSLNSDTISASQDFIGQEFLKLQNYLSDDQRFYLNALAYADILQEGVAVNVARAMLDLLIIDDMSAEAMRLGAQSIENKILVYPNPATGSLFIEGYAELPQRIFISSVTGESQHVLWNIHNESQIKIDISEHAPGIYFLQLVGNGGYSDFGTFVKR